MHWLRNASKVGRDEFLCGVFDKRCTLCKTLPSLGDAALQPRPQLQHCTEQDQDFNKSTCLTVDLNASRCEQQGTHPTFF